MGNSHFKSNVYGKTGAETIRGFTTISATTLTGGAANGFATITATALTISAAIAGATVQGTTSMKTPDMEASRVDVSGSIALDAGSYIKMGPHQYILFGAETDNDAIEAAATAVDASCAGSLYVSTDGTLWIMTDDSTVASCTVS